MQTLLLVRHAIAELRGPEWPDDSIRPLTNKGESRMREIAARLLKIGETTDVIVSSPFKRALDTARILKEEWGAKGEVAVIENLAPGHTPTQAITEVNKKAKGKTIALVGHEPDMGALAAWLIGAKQPVPFRKGGVARIDLETLSRPREGALIWLATPRILRSAD
jgi:phosphohistidine phosphatase